MITQARAGVLTVDPALALLAFIACAFLSVICPTIGALIWSPYGLCLMRLMRLLDVLRERG